jgi:hypothetical protein
MRSVCALSNMRSMTQVAFVAAYKSLCSLTHRRMTFPRCKSIAWMADTIKHRTRVCDLIESEWRKIEGAGVKGVNG